MSESEQNRPTNAPTPEHEGRVANRSQEHGAEEESQQNVADGTIFADLRKDPASQRPSRSTLSPDRSRDRSSGGGHGKKPNGGPSVLLMIALALLAALVGILVARWWVTPGEIYNKELMAELEEAPLKTKFVTKVEDESEWPQWRGPYRDGIARSAKIVTDWTDLLAKRKLWEADVGKGYSAIVVADGRAYTMFQDGDQTEAVVCWDATSGKELWRFRYDANYKIEFGPSPRSTPCIDGDRIYTVSGNGILHCLDTTPSSDKGEKIWSVDLTDVFGGKIPRWGVAFSPLIIGDLVYVIPGGKDGKTVAALDKETGGTKWTSLRGDAGYSSPVAAVIGGKEQVLFMTGKGIGGLSPDEGTRYWWHNWRTPHQVNAATPVVARDHVFISSGYSMGCALLKIAPADNQAVQAQLVYSTRDMGNHFPSSVLYDGHVYGFDDQFLTCMNLRTAKVKWKQRMTEGEKPNPLGKGSLLLVTDAKTLDKKSPAYLIVLSETGELVLAKAQPEKFEQLAAIQVFDKTKRPSECWTVPTFARGRLYLRNQHRLVCLDLRP